MLRSETAASPARQAAALAGLEAYQNAPRPPARDAMRARYRQGRVRLRDYGGDGPAVVVVPSLINPPHVLDLGAARSLLRWLAAQGFRVWLVDWGAPGPAEASRDIGGHVGDLLRPLIRQLPVPPLLVGYCLGGTMALAAAALVPVAGVATIASPWHFTGYDEATRAAIAQLWRSAEPACRALGLVPIEVLQAGFWQLDPARTISKYEAFGTMDSASEHARGFVALEDWPNTGAPLTFPAGAELFEAMIAADAPGRGAWQVDDVRIDPSALACPTIEFVSLTDRIVPAATAAGLAERRDVAAGHVGMIVGGKARAQLWEPLADWLSRVAAPR